MSAAPLPGHTGTPGMLQGLRTLRLQRWQRGQQLGQQLGQHRLGDLRELRRVQHTLAARLAPQTAQHKWEALLQLGPHRSAASLVPQQVRHRRVVLPAPPQVRHRSGAPQAQRQARRRWEASRELLQVRRRQEALPGFRVTTDMEQN